MSQATHCESSPPTGLVRSDLELLAAWRGRDQAAGAELFRRHYDIVSRFFHYKVGTDASDLIQQTFLLCIECCANFQGRSSFRSYLLGIARNVLFKHLSRRYPNVDVGVTALRDLGPSMDGNLAKQREEQRLLHALRRLPVDAQVLLELYFWEGLQGHELAEMYGVPVPTIRSRLRRAREKLTEVLEVIENEGVAPSCSVADLDVWAATVKDLRVEIDDRAVESVKGH